MRIGFKTSLKSGRCIFKTPTKHILPDLQKVNAGKRQQLEKIVSQKPVVDGLIEKVGKLKIKPKVADTQKELVKSQQEYKKKLQKKPKKRISLEF